MDKFLTRKRTNETDVESGSDDNMEYDLMDSVGKEAENQSILLQESQRVLPSTPQSIMLPASAHAPELSKAQQKIEYKSHLTYNLLSLGNEI